MDAHVGSQGKGYVGIAVDTVELVALKGAVNIDALALAHKLRENI